jgi:hypothetical protein
MTGAEARALARRLYPGSTGLQGAFLKGWRAGRRAATVDACPYLGGPRRGARPGWRPIWRNAWLRGYGHGWRARP